MSAKLSWIFGGATVLAYGFAFGIGANDVANRSLNSPYSHVLHSLLAVIYIIVLGTSKAQVGSMLQLWNLNRQWRTVHGPSYHCCQYIRGHRSCHVGQWGESAISYSSPHPDSPIKVK